MAPVSAVGLLVVGLLAFRAVTAQAPAFQEEMLVEGILGDTRLKDRAAMYDEGSYLFQMGYGYVMADVLSFAGIESPDEVATASMSLRRLEKANALLADSLRRDPANAHAWFYYAQTLAAVADVEAASAALDISWELAPTTHRISVPRLFLIKTIQTITNDPYAHSQIEQADLELLKIYQPRSFQTISEQ